MVTYARQPQKIDHQKSRRWSLASLGSVGVGHGPYGVGVQLFDLVNLATGRAHRLELKTVGVGWSGPIPFSGSVGASGYEDFSTARDVSFLDFNGTPMTVRETNVLLYSWTTVSFWGMSVRIADGGLNVPGVGASQGVANILFADGRPVGTPQLEPVAVIPPGPRDRHTAVVAPERDAGIRVPGDVLFGFNKHRLNPGRGTDERLHDLVRLMAWAPDQRYLIEGHTDGVGDAAYNVALGKRRADTVAAWIAERHPHFGPQLKTVGIGERRPVESNRTAEGRAKNRRIEVWTLPQKIWADY